MSPKPKEAQPRRYRVARAFTHEGRLITHASQLAKFPASALKERIERGYIEDRTPAVPEPAPATKAKE